MRPPNPFYARAGSHKPQSKNRQSTGPIPDARQQARSFFRRAKTLYNGKKGAGTMKKIAFEEEWKRGKIPCELFLHDPPSDGLAIVLPGRGYTAKAPLLYYASKYYFQKGFDLLQIHYHDILPSTNESEFIAAVQETVRNFLNRHPYANFCIVAKSIGTIALARLCKWDEFREAKALWLTPLLHRDDVFQGLKNSRQKGLVAIGNADPAYAGERFQELKANPNLDLLLIPGADHSLELEMDIEGSIDILKTLLAAVKKL
ncbi:MAG: alpha/beta hydrolase [Bacillaceae bacterium]|nr:alpha/beta hydrolase [Bacillaceae bacterium]